MQAIGTTLVPLATIALFSLVIVNSSDKRFTESKEASDKRFADSKEASDKRFADSKEASDKRFEASDKRFADSKEASDKRFEASDKRFADMIATFSSVRGADKETLNAIVEKLAADIAVVNRAANKGAA